jgi:hypothetical protein
MQNILAEVSCCTVKLQQTMGEDPEDPVDMNHVVCAYG